MMVDSFGPFLTLVIGTTKEKFRGVVQVHGPNSPMRLEQEEKEKAERGVM